MSNFVWCHGPSCHKSHTQDRIRGVKGSKVLRTRKVKQDQWNSGERYNMYSNFCSQGCYNDFANKNAQRIIALDPRTEPLETRIEDPKKVKHTGNYTYSDGTRHTWTTTEIKKIDSNNNVG